MPNLLLTGAAGFIGHHVAAHFLAEGWHVTSLDRLDEAGTLANLAPLKALYGKRLSHLWHDLRSPINPVRLRANGAFDHVVHIAAASHVDRSVRDPVGYVQDNVVGTAHLLEYVRDCHPEAKVLYFSTDEVFGPADDVWAPFDEYSAHTPNNPYAASKAAAEALCPAWANTYGLRIVVSHCTNVYGRGQYREKFVPLCVDSISSGKPIQIHARNGVPSSRYYVHVSDVAKAVETILEKGATLGGKQTGKYNISGDCEWSNLEIAEKIGAILGKKPMLELVEFVANRPRHDQRYAVTSTRLEALGWRPTVSIDDGLRDYVEGALRLECA